MVSQDRAEILMTTGTMHVPAKPDPGVEKAGTEGDSGAPKAVIRFYRKEDRAAVRKICADTGFLGSPIDPLFEDRELFADYLTQYYTDREPQSTLVCEVNGQIMGYLMGSRLHRSYRLYRIWNNAWLFLKGIYRYFSRPYNAASRQYIRWLLSRASAESPHTPQGLPHFHINILAQARSVGTARAIIDHFLDYLKEHGDKGVYGQVIAFEGRRSIRTFERYGFRVVDQAEITKYRHLREGQVFLFTIIKDLTVNTRLYGNDLHQVETAGSSIAAP